MLECAKRKNIVAKREGLSKAEALTPVACRECVTCLRDELRAPAIAGTLSRARVREAQEISLLAQKTKPRLWGRGFVVLLSFERQDDLLAYAIDAICWTLLTQFPGR